MGYKSKQPDHLSNKSYVEPEPIKMSLLFDMKLSLTSNLLKRVIERFPLI